MCYVDKDLPTEFPPLGLHDIPAVAKVVALALAAVLLLLLLKPTQLSHWQSIRTITVIADTAVEPHNIWR